jgi:hypothetical protein
VTFATTTAVYDSTQLETWWSKKNKEKKGGGKKEHFLSLQNMSFQ